MMEDHVLKILLQANQLKMWVFECSVDIAVDSECRLGVCFLFYDDAVLTAIRVAAAWIGLHSIHKSNGMSTMFFNNA